MNDQKERSTSDIIQETVSLSCPVQKAVYYMDAFLKELMCGRCFPCALGTYEAAAILRSVTGGNAHNTDIIALQRIADAMLTASRCKRGRDTAVFLADLLKSETFSDHVNGRCAGRECTAYIDYRIIPEKCVLCGECQSICRYHAVVGEKKVPYLSGYLPFEIVSKRCTRCGECIKVCPTGAIVVSDREEETAAANRQQYART
jgi:NAD-dependent dihydropyrimidine dehydrogenase PreA subunit